MAGRVLAVPEPLALGPAGRDKGGEAGDAAIYTAHHRVLQEIR